MLGFCRSSSIFEMFFLCRLRWSITVRLRIALNLTAIAVSMASCCMLSAISPLLITAFLASVAISAVRGAAVWCRGPFVACSHYQLLYLEPPPEADLRGNHKKMYTLPDNNNHTPPTCFRETFTECSALGQINMVQSIRYIYWA